VSGGHAHGISAAAQNRRRLTIVLALTSAYLVAEVVGGLLTGSLALLADAGHMLTDVGGLALALLAMRFGLRPANPARTYGYFRLEILAALANGVVLVGVSVYILYEAYARLRRPPEVASLPMMVVAGVGLLVNVAGVLLLRARSSQSLNLKGAYFEILSDLLSSVGVLAAGAIMLATNWYYADPLVSAGIGVFILPRTWRLIREAVGVLLEGTPAEVNIAALRHEISGVPGVAGVHDLHVWSLTSGMNAMSAHVVLSDGASFDAVVAAVRERARETFKIDHVTLQPEACECADADAHL
jgi:cobalt-zinc-cadmium efflux system protein